MCLYFQVCCDRCKSSFCCCQTVVIVMIYCACTSQIKSINQSINKSINIRLQPRSLTATYACGQPGDVHGGDWNLQDWKMTNWKLADWNLADKKMSEYTNTVSHYSGEVAQVTNKSSQRPHTSAKENMVWIWSPKFNGDFLVYGHTCDKIFMKIRSLSPEI